MLDGPCKKVLEDIKSLTILNLRPMADDIDSIFYMYQG